MARDVNANQVEDDGQGAICAVGPDGALDGAFSEGLGATAPVPYTKVDDLLSQFAEQRQQIEEMGAYMAEALRLDSSALYHFIEANLSDRRYTTYNLTQELFQVEPALAHLTATFWQKALKMTDVLDIMPQARRTEWNKQIEERNTPPFTRENLESTLEDLLRSRHKFFGERIDGVFRALSGDHVTNTPQGFYKRMILGYVFNDWGSTNSHQSGHIHDLRCVIGKFMGRGETPWYSTERLLKQARANPGQWFTADGGAIRVRAYRVGTAHLEVHPMMAYRLNLVLASLYPRAIPSHYRQRPKRQPAGFTMIERPLPFAVVEAIASGKCKDNRFIGAYAVEGDGVVWEEVVRVLSSVGGVVQPMREVKFDYDPSAVCEHIVRLGTLPDDKAYQFYPTPDVVAEAALEFAEIGAGHTVLEPSAGLGALAERARDRGADVTCVELSDVRVAVLKAKGFTVDRADFIEWCAGPAKGRRFDRVLMNPPFADGRAYTHVAAAADMVAPGGALVAVLPASAANKVTLPGWNLTWSRAFANEFAGTSVAVVVMRADRPEEGGGI